MFRLNELRDIKNNQLVIIIVRFLLIDEQEEVNMFLAVEEFFRRQSNRDISVTASFLATFNNIAHVFGMTLHVKLEFFNFRELNADERVIALHQQYFVVVFDKYSTISLIGYNVSHFLPGFSDEEVVPSNRFLRNLVVALIILFFLTSFFVIDTE